ncbi:hypothetical protein ACWJKU_08190 [Methylocaldum sp. MU1018]
MLGERLGKESLERRRPGQMFVVAPTGAVKVADQVDVPAAQPRRERLRNQRFQDLGGERIADELAPGDHIAQIAQAPLELAAVERVAGFGLDLAL